MRGSTGEASRRTTNPRAARSTVGDPARHGSRCRKRRPLALTPPPAPPLAAAARAGRRSLSVYAGNKGSGGPFAPLVVVVRNYMGTKEFNQFRGKMISLHSQGAAARACGCWLVWLIKRRCILTRAARAHNQPRSIRKRCRGSSAAGGSSLRRLGAQPSPDQPARPTKAESTTAARRRNTRCRAGPRLTLPLAPPDPPAVIKEFGKEIGADNKQVQGVIRLAKKNGEKLGFLA